MNLHGIEFVKLLDEQQIDAGIRRLAERINKEYEGKDPLFIAVLNGAFMFASDLMKQISGSARISFIKLSSYNGMETTGNVMQLIGLDQDIRDQDIIILEDIIDTGITIRKLMAELRSAGSATVRLAALLTKNKEIGIPIDYLAFEIEDEFVVGYGMDFDGTGRNLKHVYVRKSGQ